MKISPPIAVLAILAIGITLTVWLTPPLVPLVAPEKVSNAVAPAILSAKDIVLWRAS